MVCKALELTIPLTSSTCAETASFPLNFLLTILKNEVETLPLVSPCASTAGDDDKMLRDGIPDHFMDGVFRLKTGFHWDRVERIFNSVF